MRERGAGIIIQGGKIALIKRVKSNETYFVFPGGGIERQETPEEATIREVNEELGLQVSIRYLLHQDRKMGHYYYVCDIIGGEFGTGTGEEYEADNKNRGTYEPLWISVNAILSLDVRPKKIARLLFSKLKKRGEIS